MTELVGFPAEMLPVPRTRTRSLALRWCMPPASWHKSALSKWGSMLEPHRRRKSCKALYLEAPDFLAMLPLLHEKTLPSWLQAACHVMFKHSGLGVVPVHRGPQGQLERSHLTSWQQPSVAKAGITKSRFPERKESGDWLDPGTVPYPCQRQGGWN